MTTYNSPLPAAGNRRVTAGLVATRRGRAGSGVGVQPGDARCKSYRWHRATDPDHNVILHMKGPTDVLQTDLIFQPGATTGWHIHPGPVVVVVKSGALTEIHSNGCMTRPPCRFGVL